jgi:hypothetical protein
MLLPGRISDQSGGYRRLVQGFDNAVASESSGDL